MVCFKCSSTGQRAAPSMKKSLILIFSSVLCAVPSLQAQLFSDNFTRGSDPLPLSSPWGVQSGTWTVTGGALRAGTNTSLSYAFAYTSNNWLNYSVQARLRFQVGGFGGGLAGRLNPATGSHYAAWIYPENSPGGSNVLKLIKFQDWTSFGYNGNIGVPMLQTNLAAVGTNYHTVKLTFQTNTITVFFDTNQVV